MVKRSLLTLKSLRSENQKQNIEVRVKEKAELLLILLFILAQMINLYYYTDKKKD